MKNYEISIISFENPLKIVISKRFSNVFMQILSRFHGLDLFKDMEGLSVIVLVPKSL